MRIFKGDVHSLDEVKTSLEHDDTLSFIPVLKKHHDFLRESISVLLSKDTLPNEKMVQLGRFLSLLTMHSQAEEETLYVGLRTADDQQARIEGTAAQDEHDIAAGLSDELKDMGCESFWSETIAAKAHVLASLVLNHIKEEESEIFATAKKELDSSQLDSLRNEYLDKCRIYLDEEISISPTLMNEHSPSARF